MTTPREHEAHRLGSKAVRKHVREASGFKSSPIKGIEKIGMARHKALMHRIKNVKAYGEK